MKKIFEETDKLNPYTNFWNFVFITAVFFGLADFFEEYVNNIVVIAAIQFIAVILLYNFVSPFLGKLIKGFCLRTKIPIGFFTFIFFVSYVVLRLTL